MDKISALLRFDLCTKLYLRYVREITRVANAFGIQRITSARVYESIRTLYEYYPQGHVERIIYYAANVTLCICNY